MNKQLRRTPLATLVALVAVLAVPAVAQAHHVESTAACALVANQPTVTLDVRFVSFSTTKQVTGTITFDGALVKNVVPADVTWNGIDGRLVYTTATTAGQHTVQGDFTWPGKSATNNGAAHHTVACPKPAAAPGITLEKSGAPTAVAGSTFTYSFKATNTGNVALANVMLTDVRCQSPLERVEPNLAEQSFDPGDEWFYSCTATAPAGPARVDNVAEVCGEYSPPEGQTTKVCDDDSHTFTVPPPGVTPSTPDSGVLPEAIVSGRAAMRGPSGCVKQAFRARVTGRSIASVTFSIDGRKVKTTRGERGVYSIKVRPSRFGFARHKIVARVRFTAASQTRPRRLPLTFRRCAKQTVTPRFTG